MKKNKIKLTLSLVFLLVLVCICLINIGSTKAQGVDELKYSQKSVYDEKEDGWIYNFSIYYPNDNSGNIYVFDGYNLKYDELDGYYVPVLNKKTGQEITRIVPEYITLSISEKYRKDIKAIAEYFNEKQFISEITINELKDLVVEEIDKEYLVDIYNRTVNSNLKQEPGNYHEKSFLGTERLESTDENLKGEWKITYILDYGDVYKTDIEFITTDGEYLSNKVVLNEQENLLLSEIEKAEKVSTSRSNIFKSKAKNNIENADLKQLLNNFYNSLNSN